MEDRLATAGFLFVLVFGVFAAYTLQALPGIRFRWRWLAWTAVIALGLIGSISAVSDYGLGPGAIFLSLIFALVAGALMAAGGATQIGIDLATRFTEERRKRDRRED